MSINHLALLIAAAVSAVQAIDPTQSAELNAILNDAKGNLGQYMSVASEVSIPPEIFQVGLALATATDDSYTTLYDQIDFNEVSALMTGLPWYSSRLEPAIESALATLTPTETGSSSSASATSSSEKPSTTSSQEQSSSSSASSSSSEEPSSSEKPSATSSQEPSSSSSEEPSSTKSEETSSSSKPSSSEESSSKVTSTKSQETSSTQSSSSHSVPEQTSNGAPQVAVGMGAGVLAAAAMLL